MPGKTKRSRKRRKKLDEPAIVSTAYKAFEMDDGCHLEFTKEQWDDHVQRLYDALRAYTQKDWDELTKVVEMMRQRRTKGGA